MGQCLDAFFGFGGFTLLLSRQISPRELQCHRGFIEEALRFVVNSLRARFIVIAVGSQKIQQYLFSQ